MCRVARKGRAFRHVAYDFLDARRRDRPGAAAVRRDLSLVLHASGRPRGRAGDSVVRDHRAVRPRAGGPAAA